MKNTYAKHSPRLIPTRLKEKVRIGERELAILKDIARYRFLTSNQIFRLHFPKGSDSYCNERLMYLFHKPLRFVDRHPLPVEWGKGSPKLVYTLTKRGADFLKEKGFFTKMTYQKAYKAKKTTPAYRQHEVAVNEFRIIIEKAVKNMGWEIEEWISEADFKDPSVIKPMKVYDSVRGIYIPVAPDGFFSLINPTTQNRAIFFLEVDRATMDHTRFKLKKIRGFHLFGEIWRDLDLFWKYKDHPHTFRVLVVVDSGTDRTFNLKNDAEIEFSNDEDNVLISERFYFTELNKVTPENVLMGSIWLMPYKSKTPEERHPLFLTK